MNFCCALLQSLCPSEGLDYCSIPPSFLRPHIRLSLPTCTTLSSTFSLCAFIPPLHLHPQSISPYSCFRPLHFLLLLTGFCSIHLFISSLLSSVLLIIFIPNQSCHYFHPVLVFFIFLISSFSLSIFAPYHPFASIDFPFTIPFLLSLSPISPFLYPPTFLSIILFSSCSISLALLALYNGFHHYQSANNHPIPHSHLQSFLQLSISSHFSITFLSSSSVPPLQSHYHHHHLYPSPHPLLQPSFLPVFFPSSLFDTVHSFNHLTSLTSTLHLITIITIICSPTLSHRPLGKKLHSGRRGNDSNTVALAALSAN